MNFCINHPNLACFVVSNINKESKWKNKEGLNVRPGKNNYLFKGGFGA